MSRKRNGHFDSGHLLQTRKRSSLGEDALVQPSPVSFLQPTRISLRRPSVISVERQILHNHRFVVRRIDGVAAWCAFKTFRDAEDGLRAPFKVLASIDGELAADLHQEVLVERLLILGDNRAKVRLLSVKKYNEEIVSLRLEAMGIRPLDCFWDFENPCPFCLKIYLVGEVTRTMCCGGGSYNYYDRRSPIATIGAIPPELGRLVTPHYEGFDEMESELFRLKAREYNNRLALSVCSVRREHDDGATAFKRFNHSKFSVTIEGGATYHCMKKCNEKNGLNFFLTNGAEDYGDANEISLVLLRKLLGEQAQSNRFLREIYNVYRAPTHMVSFKATSNHFEVHSVRTDGSYNRNLTIHARRDSAAIHVDLESKLYEPLAYPLFFPNGEYGWSKEDNLTLYQYTRTRLYQPENLDGCVMSYNTKILTPLGFKCIDVPFNRFRLFPQLGQYYVLDQYSRMVDARLKFLKNNQSAFFGLNDSDSDDSENEDDGRRRIASKKSFLPDSFTEGKRNLKKKARNVLEIASQFGRPHFFITLTTNTEWREIQEMLTGCENAYTAPEITCRVFKVKLTTFIQRLKDGCYFGGKKLEWISHVIEYQHRGLPHAHIVVRLEGMPDFSDKAAVCKWIDSDDGISATLPSVVEGVNSPQDSICLRCVNQHMLHRCMEGDRGCLRQDGSCKRGYDRTALTLESSFDEKGYPKYKRTATGDLNVVPYNKKILTEWNGIAIANGNAIAQAEIKPGLSAARALNLYVESASSPMLKAQFELSP